MPIHNICMWRENMTGDARCRGICTVQSWDDKMREASRLRVWSSMQRDSFLWLIYLFHIYIYSVCIWLTWCILDIAVRMRIHGQWVQSQNKPQAKAWQRFEGAHARDVGRSEALPNPLWKRFPLRIWIFVSQSQTNRQRHMLKQLEKEAEEDEEIYDKASGRSMKRHGLANL